MLDRCSLVWLIGASKGVATHARDVTAICGTAALSTKPCTHRRVLSILPATYLVNLPFSHKRQNLMMRNRTILQEAESVIKQPCVREVLFNSSNFA